MNWPAIYKELEFSFGWHRENGMGQRTASGLLFCSPTRNVAIGYGDIWTRIGTIPGRNFSWKRQGKLPPVKDFGIGMDKKTKLLTYVAKDGTPLIAVDIS